MSKMGEVYLDIHELGYTKVKEIEDYINIVKLGSKYTEYALMNEICVKYNLHVNTAIMLISGAKDYKHSTMLSREELDNGP